MLNLIDQKDTHSEQYAYIVPYKNGKDIAWLQQHYEDVGIYKNADVWYGLEHKNLKQYIAEIKSGKGNWIIGPGQSSYGVDWDDLDFEKASVVKRVLKITVESIEGIS